MRRDQNRCQGATDWGDGIKPLRSCSSRRVLSCGAVIRSARGHPFCVAVARVRPITAPFVRPAESPYPVGDGQRSILGPVPAEKTLIDVARSMGLWVGPARRRPCVQYGGTSPSGTVGRLMVAANTLLSGSMTTNSSSPGAPAPRRLRQRGFNQSVLLAREISRHRGIPLDFLALRRVVDTESQAGLKKDDRRTNMKKAFSVSDPARIRGRRILLVDDVHTTGSTLGECAKTLLAGGAESVGALTLARAIREPL